MGDENLMFKCKMKGRKKEIQFQIFAGCRIDQISFLPCIHQHFLSLETNKMNENSILYTKEGKGVLCNGKIYVLPEISRSANVAIFSVDQIDL